MSDLTTELREELDAFDPKWKEHYPSIGAAALAAEATELFARWVKTDDGKKYLGTITGLPDHVGDSKREAEALMHPRSLPFGYANIYPTLDQDDREFRPR